MTDAIPEGFELVNCPACGSDRWSESRAGKDWALNPQRTIHIVRCDKCGLNFTNPRPDSAHLGDYYTAEYAPYKIQRGEIQHGWRGTVAVRTWVLARAYGAPHLRPRGWRNAAAAIVTFIQPIHYFGFGVPVQGTGKLLDFGCGSGKFLRRMQAVGWSCTGVDFSADAVAAVRASGIPAVQGSLPHPDLLPDTFDVITMRSSLEHIANPRDVITAAHELLRPGGKLIIQVPNFRSWEIEYFGDAAWQLDLPRHLLHFTPETLHDLLLRCGFARAQVQQTSRSGGLRKSLSQINRREPKQTDWLMRFGPIQAFAAARALKQNKANELIATAHKSGTNS